MPFSSSKSNTRLPSNIPLRTLHDASSAAHAHHDTHDSEESTSFLRPGARAGASHQGYRVDKPGSDDSEDDTDSWVETGDIGDQIDAEDPLRARLNDTLDESALAGLKPRHAHHHSASASASANPHGSGSGSKREKKRVRIHGEATYHDHDGSLAHSGVVDKEAIEIPEVISHKPSTAQRLFAAIMPGSSRGFTGKPLMYVSVPLRAWARALYSGRRATVLMLTP